MLHNNQPDFTIEEARQIALQLYGLHVEVCALPGERDCNFFLKTEAAQEFVLKIASAVEQTDTLDLQNKALEHMGTRDPSLLLPQVICANSREAIATVTDAAGTKHFVRLLSFIPGKSLAETKPHTPELLHSLGSTMGKMDQALEDFTHPAAHRTLRWDLQRTLWTRDYLHHIEPPERRAMIEHFLSQFEEQVLPKAPELRMGIIHNDANDYNVLVNAANGESRRVV